MRLYFRPGIVFPQRIDAEQRVFANDDVQNAGAGRPAVTAPFANFAQRIHFRVVQSNQRLVNVSVVRKLVVPLTVRDRAQDQPLHSLPAEHLADRRKVFVEHHPILSNEQHVKAANGLIVELHQFLEYFSIQRQTVIEIASRSARFSVHVPVARPIEQIIHLALE